jgi:DNA-directed RNA polymerase specialized sigma subunit
MVIELAYYEGMSQTEMAERLKAWIAHSKLSN